MTNTKKWWLLLWTNILLNIQTVFQITRRCPWKKNTTIIYNIHCLFDISHSKIIIAVHSLSFKKKCSCLHSIRLCISHHNTSEKRVMPLTAVHHMPSERHLIKKVNAKAHKWDIIMLWDFLDMWNYHTISYHTTFNIRENSDGRTE